MNIFPGARFFQSPNYGYPTIRAGRRRKPTILAVIHVADSITGAENQTKWSFTTNSKSWTFMLDRDGSVVQSLDPVTQTPWTNGDIQQPDMSNPLTAGMVGSSYNPNEFCFLTIENVGIPLSDPITKAQEASIRRILAWASELSGIPINRRTVIGHYQINSVTRERCPVMPGQRADFFNRLVGSIPDTGTEEDPAVIAELQQQVKDLKAKVAAYWKWIVALRAAKDDLKAQVADLDSQVTRLEAQVGTLPHENAELKATVKRLRTRVTTIKGKANQIADIAADISDD